MKLSGKRTSVANPLESFPTPKGQGRKADLSGSRTGARIANRPMVPVFLEVGGDEQTTRFQFPQTARGRFVLSARHTAFTRIAEGTDTMSPRLKRTPLYDRHVRLGATMVEFGGWDMPIRYPHGIIEEHLATRGGAGLFDVSHMGRFAFRGAGALAFLQHVLTNDASAPAVGRAQYTIIPDAAGGAVDDAYLYRFQEDEYLLVVNAANRSKDWAHFESILPGFRDVEMIDRSQELSMLSLQGPLSGDILAGLVDSGSLPQPRRNSLACAIINGAVVLVARTGYTGEPTCLEVFVETASAARLWDILIERGASPVGLGARDTLRLEACLPLYGHELGTDAEGHRIPIFASGPSRFAVSLTGAKGDFVGREALTRQYKALEAIAAGDFSLAGDLPRVIRPLAVQGRSVARAGAAVLSAGNKAKPIGYVTSGTVVPYPAGEDKGPSGKRGPRRGMRVIALALVESRVREGERVLVDIRGKKREALVVRRHIRGGKAGRCRPVIHNV